MTWWRALVAAGAVPAGYVPPLAPNPGESRTPTRARAEIIEDAELQAHPVGNGAPDAVPLTVSFLDGIGRWSVKAYDGYVPLVHAYVAAAVRRRIRFGTLRTTHEKAREFVIAPLERMDPARRRLLADLWPDIAQVDGDEIGHPTLYLESVETTVRRARAHLEREVAEAALARLDADEWLVVDGLLSRWTSVARHPRTLGVIRTHGAQFLEGRGLERALTLPAGHRTSVFRVEGGHTRTEVLSWYLRLWPWEGKDLLYGLIRVEVGAHQELVKQASALSAWLLAERAPLAAPLYPLHHVEEYLKSRRA